MILITFFDKFTDLFRLFYGLFDEFTDFFSIILMTFFRCCFSFFPTFSDIFQHFPTFVQHPSGIFPASFLAYFRHPSTPPRPSVCLVPDVHSWATLHMKKPPYKQREKWKNKNIFLFLKDCQNSAGDRPRCRIPYFPILLYRPHIRIFGLRQPLQIPCNRVPCNSNWV